MNRSRVRIHSMLVYIISFIFILSFTGCSKVEDDNNKISISDKIEEVRSDEDYVTLENISDDFIKAIVAIEDRRFYDHGAVDLISLARATVKNLVSKDIVEGGSTITQQLAKNIFLTGEQTMKRKLKEIYIAYKLEENYTKDEIIELYVNVIYFGDNHYGISEACRGYFKKEPSELTFDEATLLAGLPQAPSLYSLSKNYDRALKRQQEVIKALNQ